MKFLEQNYFSFVPTGTIVMKADNVSYVWR